MSEELLKQKAREICYALIKIAYFIKRQDLRLKIEKQAFDFLENAAVAIFSDKGDMAALKKLTLSVSVLDVLVRMGHSLYEIEPVNATILIRELDAYNAAMRQFVIPADSNKAELPDLNGMFSASLFNSANIQRQNEAESKLIEKKPLLINKDKKIQPNLNKEEKKLNDKPTVFNLPAGAVERQNKIMDKFKQIINTANGDNSAIAGSGINSGVRMKDLLVAFPDVSERTLRNDLQKLVEQKLIERVGVGGPASYYRILGA